MLGDVGRHSDLPLENLSLSRCGSFLASCSHDSDVRFWNIESIKTETVDASRRANKTKRPKLASAANNREFFADLATDATTSTADDKTTVSTAESSEDEDIGSEDEDVGSDDSEKKCND